MDSTGGKPWITWTLALCFGLPFVGFGLLILTQTTARGGTARVSVRHGVRHPRPRNGDALKQAIGGAVFLLAGGCIIAAGGTGAEMQRVRGRLTAAHPGQPWRWRRQWANGVVLDDSVGAITGTWLVAMLCSAIIFPGSMAGWQVYRLTHQAWLLPLIFGFPLVAIGTFFAAVRSTLSRLRLGRAVLVMDAYPARRGSTLAGVIELGRLLPAGTLLTLSLTCSLRPGTRGRYAVNTARVVWRHDQTVATRGGSERSTLPVRFDLPADLPASDDSFDRVTWRLTATTDSGFLPSSARFGLPVF